MRKCLVMLGHVLYDAWRKNCFKYCWEEKKKLTVEDLLRKFEVVAGEEFSSDKALLAKKVFFLNRETEIHKSERINKFTVDDVCPDYYWVDFEKDQSDWQGRTEKHDESCY